eukprot:scaffold482_cov266-Amphora_coffeaeformis.AAC.37
MSTKPTTRRVALVSGANKGIGKEIVRLLYSQTASSEDQVWTIFLGSRDMARGEAAAQEIISSSTSAVTTNNKIICCHLDLTCADSIQSTYEQIQSKAGHLDVLINNAAICFNDPTLYGQVAYTPFEQQASITIQTNFFGTLAVTETMLPLLQISPFTSRIINIASAAGRLAILKSPELRQVLTDPALHLPRLKELLQTFVKDVEAGTHASKGWPNTCYGMSKLGLIAWTKLILARDYPEIMCNSVDPGYCATDQNNNQGVLPAARGAITPVLLATTQKFVTGKHWFQEQEIAW